METLSNLFKKSEIFSEEFDKIFPSKPFTKFNILNYISACTEIVLTEAQQRFPSRRLKFINPLFIVDGEIFPAANLTGDEAILKLTRPFFGLVQSKTIIPLSIPILENLLSGVCLCYGNTTDKCEYQLFKKVDLDSLPYEIDFRPDEIDQQRLHDEVSNLKIDIDRFTEDFEEFAKYLSVFSYQDKIKLTKTLALYKNISKTISPTLFYSFVNKYNQTHSFFDCLLTLISEKPFDEDELLDFANIVEGISLPIANYDHNKSKGISAQTMAKRNSLKSMLINSFRQS
jgi:hypothetical protein